MLARIINKEIQIPELRVNMDIIDDVLIVPSENKIIVNGITEILDFPYEENLHAIYWNQKDKMGRFEFIDDRQMNLCPALFESEVLPYIKLYAQKWLGQSWQYRETILTNLVKT